MTQHTSSGSCFSDRVSTTSYLHFCVSVKRRLRTFLKLPETPSLFTSGAVESVGTFPVTSEDSKPSPL